MTIVVRSSDLVVIGSCWCLVFSKNIVFPLSVCLLTYATGEPFLFHTPFSSALTSEGSSSMFKSTQQECPVDVLLIDSICTLVAYNLHCKNVSSLTLGACAVGLR